ASRSVTDPAYDAAPTAAPDIPVVPIIAPGRRAAVGLTPAAPGQTLDLNRLRSGCPVDHTRPSTDRDGISPRSRLRLSIGRRPRDLAQLGLVGGLLALSALLVLV